MQRKSGAFKLVVTSAEGADRLLRAVYGVTAGTFARREHQCEPVFPGGGLAGVCTTCGALVTRPLWGRAPGQPRLDGESERQYVLEQQS